MSMTQESTGHHTTQPSTDGHTPPTNGTTSASRRPPMMGTRWPIPLLSTGKPLRGATPTHHHHHHQPSTETVGEGFGRKDQEKNRR